MVAPSEILSEVIPKISISACCFAYLKSLKWPMCKVLKIPDIKIVFEFVFLNYQYSSVFL